MANDKKFIVKNGLLTPQNVVIGSTTDTGEKLQVTGSSLLTGAVEITQSTASTPSLDVRNSAGYLQSSIVANFRGDSDSLQIINESQGDYTLKNSQQDNGITFHDGTAGLSLKYNGSARLDINSGGNEFTGLATTTIEGNRIITTADEGPGNNFDADTVDGLEGSQLVRSDVDDIMAGNYTIQQDLTIQGDLTVSGNTTTVNTEEILLADNIITLNSNYTGSAPTENSGIEIERGTLDNPKILWDESSDYWKLVNGSLADLGRIITTADEGPGNGFDADTVDGLEGSQFLRSDVDDTANGNITILGNIIVGDNVGGAEIVFDGVGQDRRIYSQNGDIGFLNAGFNYAAKSDSDDNFIVGNDVSAGANVHATDTVIAGNDIIANTGSVSAATTVTAGTDVIGQRFVDADNNSYFVNPNADSTMHSIGLDDDLFHNGDPDTKVSFTTDDISLQTGGSERLGIQNGSVSATVDIYAPNIVVNDAVIHNNDTNTKVGFATDTITLETGGSVRLTANNTGVHIDDLTAGTVIGDNAYFNRYYDRGDNTYYGDFAGTSVLNNLGINDYIYHNGDLNTYFGFDSNDNIKFFTDGTERLEINDTFITGAVDGYFPNLYAGKYYDSGNATYYGDFASTSRVNDISLVGEIIADGDTNTYIQFHAADQFRVVTGGVERLEVSTFTKMSGSARSPLFYDLDNTAYYGNFAGQSEMNSINIDSYIRHRGDTNNYLGFDAADSQTFVTGGVERLNITNALSTFFTPVTVQGDVQANRFVDRQSTGYFLNPADASLSATLNGAVRVGNITNNSRWGDNSGTGGIALVTDGDVGTNSTTLAISGNYSGGYALQYLNRIDPSSNPTNNGNRYIHFYHDGVAGGSIRGDSSGNLYQVLHTGTNWGFWTSGYSEALIVDDSGNVMVNNSTAPTYTVNDNTPLVGSNTNNKLHVSGSIQLASNDDAIVFGRGTSTFLKDEELGFGWGGGWYMTDGTYLRARNNKTIYTTGDIWASRYYAAADTAYYVDPDGDSQLNEVHINDWLRHRGDTNTYIGFPANDQIRLATNGAARINITNSSVRVRNALEVYGSGITLQKQSNGGGVGITVTDNNTAEMTYTQSGSIKFYHSDDSVLPGGDAFWYFNSTEVDTWYAFGSANGADGGTLVPIVNNTGELGTAAYRWASIHAQTGNYSGNVTAGNMYAARFYDSNDSNYYGDFASTSQMNRIDINDYIRHRGDTNNYIGFPSADSQTFVTGGVERLEIDNSEVTAPGKLGSATEVNAPIFYDRNDRNYYGNFNGTSVMNNIHLGSTANFPDGADPDLSTSTIFATGKVVTPKLVFLNDAAGDDNYITSTDTNTAYTIAGQNDFGAFYTFVGDKRTATAPAVHNSSSGVVASGFLARWGQFNTQIRTPIIYDLDNTGYYVNPASSTRLNTIQALRYYFNHATTYYADVASGNYGSIEVGGKKGGWAGYSIAGNYNFMSSGASEVGIYNDVDNEWMLYAARNAGLDLYYNGGKQAETENGYFLATNQMRAPIYYDSQNTAYYLNPAAGNTSLALKINGRIYRDGFDTSGNGDTNKVITAQDYSHWIWNTATNWGTFWAGNTNAAYKHFSNSNPNEYVFVGSGNVRASIDLDNGNAYFQGDVSASDFLLSGGNENISLNPAYGSGGADLVLFDATEYFEKRVTVPLRGIEDSITTTTSEYVKSDGPFAGNYVLRSSAYRTFYSDYIPVVPGEEVYGEISTRRISGSGGLLYYGIERFDKDKKPIAGNTGTTYFVVGGSNRTSTSWETLRNHTTIPTTHTVYNGSDGGGCHYVRIRILLNYNSGGALREYGGIMLKRRNAESSLTVDDLKVLDDITVGGDATITGDLLVDDITADIIDANRFRDRANTARYMDPASGGNVAGTWNWNNGSITNLNNLTFNDPGVNEGIKWNGGNQWQIYESPNNQTNAGGNLQFTSGSGNGTRNFWIEPGGVTFSRVSSRAPVFYDSDNAGYYGNFASTSRMNAINYNNISAVGGGTAYWYTGAGNLRGYMQATDTNDAHLIIATSGNEDISFRDGGLGGDWNVIMRGNGQTLFRSRTDSPIYYDRDNAAYYMNPAGNSNISTMDFDRLDGPSNSTRDKIRVYDSSSYAIGMQSGINFGGLGDWAMTFQFNNDDNRGYWWGDTSHNTSQGAMSLTTNGRLVVARSLRVGFGEGDTSAPNYVLDISGTLHTTGNIYADRYYDRNNSFYYGDFASTSRFNVVEHYGKAYFYARTTDSGGSSSYVTSGKVDEYMNNVAAEFHSGNDAPVTIYFRSGVNAPSDFGYITYDPDYDNSGENGMMVIGSENDGTGSSDGIRLQGRTIVDSDLVSSDSTTIMDWRYRNTTYGRINTDYLDHTSDIRAPIFYDRLNTGYYLNADGNSQLRAVYANDWFRAQGATGLYFQDYGYGIRSAHSEGNSYGNVSTYGTGRNGWSGYGIDRKWCIMSSGTGNSNNFGIHNNDSSWLWYWNGSYTNTRLGYLNNESSMRAPIFYDTNNTAYYFNGASDNSTRMRGISNEAMAFQALPGHTRNSGEYYRARPRITGDTNYWTGAMGWGRQDMNVVGTWGSGFIDSWSNPPNQPSGTSHWVGVQSYHYRSSNTRGYGWQMVGGPITNLRFRSSWSGWRTWRTIPVLDENSGNGGAMYAGIYYDSNNTGYYMNPASTSYWSTSQQNGYHTFLNYGVGVTGTYTSTRLQLVFAMGSSYRPNSAGTSAANMYGIGWSHPNAGGLGGANQLNDHGMLIINNGSFRAAMSSRAVFSSDVRTPIFYDWNSTGYYLDPASTSNSALRIRGGALHGPNPTWGAYLYVGSNGRPNSWASVVATNGNLHLDCQNGRAMYLNYYSGNIIYATDIRPYIMYDRNNTGYYSDPASTSRLNQLTVNRINTPYAGGNSGITRASSPYSFGFQESGGWGYPYPDLVLQYHTGMSFAGNPSYGGMRFFNDYNSGTVRFQINGGSSYTYANTWLNIGGGGVGIYDNYNGAHFFPNNQTSYTSWNIYGSRGGYYGIALSQAGYDPHFMWDGSGNGGTYLQGIGRWVTYHNRARNCLGIGSSSTVSGYQMRVNGSLYCNGNIVAYSDERKKKNIVTIDGALDKVLQLRGVYYERKDDVSTDETDKMFGGRQVGMIAQEVEKVIPEVVSYSVETDEYGLDYPKMVGLLVEAHKDQQKLINSQQEKIDKLEEMLYNIMNKMENK